MAFAGFYRDPAHADRAEVAFAVADALQGHGIGTRLLEHLARPGPRAGHPDVRRLRARRQPPDARRVSRLGLRHDHRRSSAASATSSLVARRSRRRFEAKAAARSQTAATASMKAFFEPRGRRRRSAPIANAARSARRSSTTWWRPASRGTHRAGAPDGAARSKASAPIRASTDIPGPIDLAVVVVPAAQVLAAVDDCIAKGVRAICVISAGFSECDAEGRARERVLLERVRRGGLPADRSQLHGPAEHRPGVRLNATFSPVYPPAGNVAMSTQSGALGLAILDYARRLDIGISSFVSVGNKADVSGNDLIQYWADDPQHRRHPALSRELRQSEEVQRDRAPRRPNQADRGGEGRPLERRGPRGRLAHRRAGLQRRRRRCAVPAGRRHPDRAARGAVRRGGAAVASADAARRPRRDPDQRRRPGHPGGRCVRSERARAAGARARRRAPSCDRFCPAAASVGNPVDMLASAPADHYRRALAAILRDESVDSVIAIFIPPLVTEPDAVAAAIAEGARGGARQAGARACSCGPRARRRRWRRFPATLSRNRRRWRSRGSPLTGAGAPGPWTRRPSLDRFDRDRDPRRSSSRCSAAAAAGRPRKRPTALLPRPASVRAGVASPTTADERGAGRGRARLSGGAQGAGTDAAAQDRAPRRVA